MPGGHGPGGVYCLPPPCKEVDALMTRDELRRELRMHSASWQAVVIVYALIIAAMVGSAMAII